MPIHNRTCTDPICPYHEGEYEPNPDKMTREQLIFELKYAWRVLKETGDKP